jgi:hypothetical protein
MMAKRTD